MPTMQKALWPAVAFVGLAAAASAVGQATNTHGAATTEEQMRALDALGVSPDGGKLSGNVDERAWAATVPADNATNAARVALGKKLYFETALSKDGTVACATCHDSTRTFTDLRPVSEGVGGQLGRRNAPTTMNAALLQLQFWDGRATTLEEQSGQPILNPVEMALGSRDEAIAKLVAKGGYEPLFQAAYGRNINYEDLQRALAAFERTLVFLDAPFDRYLAGDRSAISDEARAGFELFNGKARCVACHAINRSNPLGSDNRFHNIGVSARKQDFEQLARKAIGVLQQDPSERQLDALAIGSDLSELGRFMVTKSYADIGAFRTPQLRNTGITGPYMHDGSLQTLWDVMDHYNKGGEANPFLDGGMEALALTEQELDQLVAFMFTLTDDRFKALNGTEQTRQRGLANKQRPFRDDPVAQRKVLDFERRALGHTLGGGK